MWFQLGLIRVASVGRSLTGFLGLSYPGKGFQRVVEFTLLFAQPANTLAGRPGRWLYHPVVGT